MDATYQDASTTWLRTDHPVVSVNPSLSGHVPAVEAASHRGLAARADTTRPGFYDIGICGNWYYVHIPVHIERVYLVALATAEFEQIPLAVLR